MRRHWRFDETKSGPPSIRIRRREFRTIEICVLKHISDKCHCSGRVVPGKACGGAQALVERWAAALESRDVQAAAALTSYPGAAAPMIEQLFDGLSPQEVHVTPTQVVGLTDAAGVFTTDVRWAFGDGKEWRYSVGGQVREVSIGWRVSWDPSLLVPGLSRDR